MAGGPGRSRRDAGVTALAEGYFAAAWFGWAMAAAPSGLHSWLVVGCAAALIIAAAGTIVGLRSPLASSALHDRQARRRYGITVGIEFGIAGIGACVLAATGESGFTPVWVCGVVGVHFFPLAPVLRDRMLIPLGVLMCAATVTALAIALTTNTAASTVTGVGAGCSLLAFALISLAGTVSMRHDVQTDRT